MQNKLSMFNEFKKKKNKVGLSSFIKHNFEKLNIST